MKSIELNPNEGIYISGVGPINFGITKSKLLEMLDNINDNEDNKIYYLDDQILFTFNKENSLTAFEFFNSKTEDQIQLNMFDKDWFLETRDSLVESLIIKNYKIGGNSYKTEIEGLGLEIIQDYTPLNIQEEIDEAQAEGKYSSKKDYFDERLKKSVYIDKIIMKKD